MSHIPLKANLGEVASDFKNGNYNSRGTYTAESTTVGPGSRNGKVDPPTLPVSIASSNKLMATFKPYHGRPRLHF